MLHDENMGKTSDKLKTDKTWAILVSVVNMMNLSS